MKTIELPEEFHPAIKALIEEDNSGNVVKTTILDHEGDELFSESCSPKQLRDNSDDVFLSDIGAWLEENQYELIS